MFRHISYKTIVSTIYLVAVMMEIIDVTIINVALPQIQMSLSAPIHLMGWITNGYILSLATAIPVSSWLGQRYGTKKILLIGIILFTIASIWCALSNDIYSLITARLLQGAGGGMLVPVGQTILFRTFEPKEIPGLLSRLSIPITLAPALGQALGGIIVQYTNWHWIFWVNIPFGIFCILGTYYYLQESEGKKTPLDIIGLSLSCLSIFTLFYSFSLIDFDADFLKPSAYFVIASLLMVLFVYYEKRCAHPFFNLEVFKNKNFRMSILCSLMIFSNIVGTFFISNFIFQDTIGWTPLQAGLTSVPFSIGFLIALKMLPRLYPEKYTAKSILLVTNMFSIIACGLMVFVRGPDDFNFVLLLSFFRGLGFGFLVITLQSVGILGMSKELMNDASSVITLTRYTFMGFGTALFIVITALLMSAFDIDPVSFSADKEKVMHIFHWLYGIATVFIVFGFYYIFKLKEEPKTEEISADQITKLSES